MQSEDRLVHFSTELLHKPVRHSVPDLQKLYYELSQTRNVAYDSTDFSLQGQPPRFYSRRGKRTQSIVLFLPDRVVLIEEWVDIALADFLEKVREVGKHVLNTLKIATFVAQTATLRSTFALTHFEDSRVFLMDHMCQQENRIGPFFQRPIATGGLRFVLPETPEYVGNLHVTIESFKHSRNEVFIETKGVFANLKIDAEEMEPAVDHIKLVREFISDNIFPYLDQYDTPQEKEIP